MEKKERSRPSGKTQGKPEKLTSVNGRPIADNEDSQTAGLRGPIVLQDPWMLEKLAHFDREVIPERRMHAKGSGAYGTFTVTHDITRYTRASIFSRIGKQTECFVRFSTVAGERGAADAERDIRGFAMKFYTDAGNWDHAIIRQHTPSHIREICENRRKLSLCQPGTAATHPGFCRPAATYDFRRFSRRSSRAAVPRCSLSPASGPVPGVPSVPR